MTDYERYGDYQPSDRSALGMGITMLLVGLGAGALVALLLTPHTGRQTRKILRRRYEDTLENLSDRADELRERGSEWVDKAKDFAGTAQTAAEKVTSMARERKKR
jgi:gas vesicle protein